jgi:small conductance mechanosensitive channel
MQPPPNPVPDVWHRLGLDVETFVPRTGAAVFILGCFWAAGMAADAFLRRFARTRTLDPDLAGLLARAARVSLIAVGAVTAIGTIGVDVKALVAGLGLTGFALGFALRDIISNTLAGVLILLYRPFHRGDFVSVGGADGVVTEIDLRYTTLTIDDRTRVLVPNATLFTNSIRVERRAAGPGPDA